MTRTIARQNGRQGVTAFAVAPGYVDTAFNKPFAGSSASRLAARDTGLGEVAQPQDVANIIASSRRASPATPPARPSTSTAPATSADRPGASS